MYRGLGKSRSPEARGSGGAPQPAESTADASEPAGSIADASQLGGLPSVRLNLGCFNCGCFDCFPHIWHTTSLKRVIAKDVHEQDLHMLTPMCTQDLVSEVLKHARQAYMATSQATTEPADDTGVTLTLLAGPEVVELSSPALEPQLVVMVFAIAAAGHPDKHGLLISGTLHIRTPTGVKTPTTATKKRITKEALQALEGRASIASSGASQPTAPVIVLTGDVNMDKIASDSIVQQEAGDPSVETQWQVLTSNAALSGDVLFIKGVFGEAFVVSVGASYPADASFVW